MMWKADHPDTQLWQLGWIRRFRMLGIVYDDQGGHLYTPFRPDARALDATTRLTPYGPDNGIGEEGAKRRVRNQEICRAAFERARRDPPFLEALEAITEASVSGSLSDKQVRSVLNTHVPADRANAWVRDVRWEIAARKLSSAARVYLTDASEDSARALQTALTDFEVYEQAHHDRIAPPLVNTCYTDDGDD